MELILKSIIILSALGGFSLALYIYGKKSSNQTLVCPLKSDCEAVVRSDYSKFFGLPLEFIGMAYYAAVAISYSFLFFMPEYASPFFVFSVLVASISAFLFSLYLTFIQAFALRQWCAWCLTSAGLSTIILGSALLASDFGFIGLLSEYHILILTLHAFGVAVGLGAATVADVLFFKFLKDFKISESETDILRALSQVIWLALAAIVLSGLGLYLPEAGELLSSPKFLVKMIIVAVIIVNGAVLNLLVTPKLVKISFSGEHTHEPGELRKERRTAFALGAVSIASWYSAFILGTLKSVPFDFPTLLLVYAGILVAAIASSRIMERVFVKKAGSV